MNNENKLYRQFLGGEWIKPSDGKWIRPTFPLITRKVLSETDKAFEGEKYNHSLLTQNYNTLTGTQHERL